MSGEFRRSHYRHKQELLRVTSDDGERVVVENEAGNIMLNCSRWLFDQCWKKKIFEDVDGR